MKHAPVLLGLGSNIEERYRHLKDGVSMLTQSLKMESCSSTYETEPWGYRDQPCFLNLVCRGYTNMSPKQLLDLCQKIEGFVGRKPTFRYGPRVLDIDILDYAGEVIATPKLVLPHARLPERAFVLVPLAEIAPWWEHPILGINVNQLLAEIADPEEVRLWAPPVELHTTTQGMDTR